MTPSGRGVHSDALVGCSPDPIIGLTLDGRITDWNPAAERLYGYRTEEALGASIAVLVPPELRGSTDLLARVAAGETVSQFDTQRMTKDGNRIDVSISISPVTDEHGAVVGAAAFTRDISARVVVEASLRQSQAQLDEAQKVAAMGSWEWDVITNEVTWSAGMYRILGLDPERFVPSYEGYFAHVHPADRASAEAQVHEAVAVGSGLGVEARVMRADGVERVTQSRARVIKDERGNVVRLIGTSQDVTELVRARQQLESVSRLHEVLLNSAGEGICGIDIDGRITFVNPAACLMTRFDIEDLIGQRWHDMVHHTRPDGSTHPFEQCPVSASLQDGAARRCDADVYWRSDGSSFPVQYTSTPLVDGGRVTGAVVVFTDISERLEMERAKDAFVASISHELRTPLTSIRGYLDLVMEGAAGEVTDEQQRFLRIVDRNANRLLLIVGDLLVVAQLDANELELELEDVDVGELVSDAVEVAGPQADAKGVMLETQIIMPAVLLRGDRSRLGQVVDNLLSNAIKFTPAGGRVELRSLARDGHAILEVCDSGLGISAQEQQHLFRRFYRASAASEHVIPGTGLGLTIVKALVEAHGGSVSVRSATGEGATFRVELPLDGRAGA